MGTFSKLKQTFSSKKGGDRYPGGLDKSKKSFSERIRKLALGFTGVNEKLLEDLMVILLEADIGVKTTQKIMDEVESRAMDQKLKSSDEISEYLIEAMHGLYINVEDEDFHKNEDGLTVTLMVDVNGSRKTTMMAKLTKLFRSEGSSVVLAAADTFRAGVIDQLAKQADRLGVICIKGREGGDPSTALVDACRYAKEHGMDYLTGGIAGRLQNKASLMQELSKMRRVIERETPRASYEVWLVLDAITGQNGVSQAQIFLETTKVSDIILTKMDGTAKGGIAIAIRDLLGSLVEHIGLGGKEDDLRLFDIDSYLYGLCEDALQHN